MTPVEDSLLLLAIVRRHFRTLRLGLDSSSSAEDWGFTAQQAVEKLLKARIVLANRQAPRLHDLIDSELGANLCSFLVFCLKF
jgi:HEPN domain-containing protein